MVGRACLVLASFVLMVALSALYFEWGTLLLVQRVLVGLEALLIGVLLQLTVDLGARHVRSRLAAALAVGGFAGLLLNVNPALIVFAALLAGAATYFSQPRPEARSGESVVPAVEL